MSKSTKERFFRMLNERFTPDLLDAGFRGAGRSYYRIVAPRIDVITIQSSSMGDKCCVNLGVHFDFLTAPGGSELPEPKLMREHHCEFRTRLVGGDQADAWWAYQPWHRLIGRQGDQIAKAFAATGVDFFAQFEPYPDVFEAITPEQVENGELPFRGRNPSVGRTALILARIMHQSGRLEKAREFAAVGLRKVSPQAIILKSELEALAY